MRKVRISCYGISIVADFENLSSEQVDAILNQLYPSLKNDPPKTEAALRDRLAGIVAEFFPDCNIS